MTPQEREIKKSKAGVLCMTVYLCSKKKEKADKEKPDWFCGWIQTNKRARQQPIPVTVFLYSGYFSVSWYIHSLCLQTLAFSTQENLTLNPFLCIISSAPYRLDSEQVTTNYKSKSGFALLLVESCFISRKKSLFLENQKSTSSYIWAQWVASANCLQSQTVCKSTVKQRVLR